MKFMQSDLHKPRGMAKLKIDLQPKQADAVVNALDPNNQGLDPIDFRPADTSLYLPPSTAPT